MTDLIPTAWASQADALVKLLDLEAIDCDLFRSGRPGELGWRVFGGEVCAQAVVAAERTVRPGAVLHSLHASFLRGGDTSARIVFRVERLQDGRTFQRRRVTALQHGKPILSLAASFTSADTGTAQQVLAPTAPPAEECQPLPPRPEGGWAVHPTDVFDIRPVVPAAAVGSVAAHDMWFRLRGESTGDPVSPAALLTYLSDYRLISAILRPRPHLTARFTSLDHMVWFHNEVRLDDWLYYAKGTPAAGPLRGLAEGRIFHRDGTLIATVLQEGLIHALTRDDSPSAPTDGTPS